MIPLRWFLCPLLLLAACAAPGGERWHSPLSRDHPLVGRIWRPADGAFADPGQLHRDLAAAEFVLLGEKHDNRDHHSLQARLVETLVAAGRRPGVVWEMIGEDRQLALDLHLASHPDDADGLGAALDWSKTGWPAWHTYQPIARAALAGGLPMRAGGLTRATVRAVARQGTRALGAPRSDRLALDEELPAARRQRMLEQLFEGHCKLMPRRALLPMLAVQRARDAVMADRMLELGGAGAVLIAGNGHVRRDDGVPRALRRRRPSARIVSVGLLEVDDERTDPAAYAKGFTADVLPFDFVWFTPRADDVDHCERLRKRLKGHKK